MKKTDLGYQTELNLAGGNTVNFCFKNQNNEWDNNNGQNYSFPIEKAEVSLVPTSEMIGIGAPRRLRKSYIWSKKIRLAIYKIMHYFPKIISGNYKRKATNNNI